MDYDTNPKRIAALSEPQTPGIWVCASAQITHTDGSPPTERVMMAALPPGVTPEKATNKDLIEVAMFVREADARRVFACINACGVVPTDILEAMPIADALETALQKLTNIYHAAKDDATWEAMREEILSFQTIKTAH